MAPRSTKAKKAAEAKIESNAVSKKVKTVSNEEIDQEVNGLELEVNEKPRVEKKKRGRKLTTDAKENTQLNGIEDGKGDSAKMENDDSQKVNGIKKIDQESSDLEQDEKEIHMVEKKKRGKKVNNSKPQKQEHETEIVPEKQEVPVEKKKRGKKATETKEPETEIPPEKKETPISKNKRGNKVNESENQEKDIPVVEKKKRGKKVNDVDNQEQAQETSEMDTEEKDNPAVEQKKRGRKAAVDVKEKNQTNEQEAPPAKKGRKKKAEASDEVEEKPKNGRGKKPQPKKNTSTDKVTEEAAEVDDTTKTADYSTKQKTEDAEVEPMEGVVDAPESNAKGRRRRNVEPATQNIKDAAEPKRKRKADEDKASGEDAKKKAPLKNKATTDYEEIDFSNSSQNKQGKEWNLKISSWNVDGIRAWMSKGGLEYIKREKPNILCLQEVKCSNDKLPEEVANLPGYHAYWACSDQDGYAGVGIYTTKLAMNVQYGLNDKELDNEGRIITAEYEQFYLICTYVPNAGRKLVTLPKRLQWNDAFRKYVKELDKKKPVIICGDMNVAHNEIDLSNPKTNRKNAGFTDEERAGMSQLLGDGFVDTFRHLNPDKTQAYTFWTYMMNCRAKNVGWRLDYFIISERLLPSLCDSVIRDQVYGSDHCPISLLLHLTSADKPKE